MLLVAVVLSAALLLIGKLRFSIFECLIATSPVMFYLDAGTKVNLALGDAFLPLAVVSAGALSPRLWRTPASVVLIPLCMAAALALASFSPRLNLEAGVAAILKVALGMATVFAAARLASAACRKGDFRFLRVWGAAASAIALLTVTDAAGMTDVLRSMDGIRSSGTFEDPNLYATYLLISAAIVLTPLVTWRRSVKVVSLSLLSLALLSTGSRAGLASAALLAAMLLARPAVRYGRVKAVAAAVVVGGVLVSAASWVGLRFDDYRGVARLESDLAVIQGDSRLALWGSAWDIFTRYPVAGVGPGQFQDRYGAVPHNTYLTFLAESGIIGFTPLAVLLIYLLRQSFTVWGTLGRSPQPALLAGVTVILVQMLSLNLQNVRFVWLFFGIVLGIAAWSHVDTNPQSRLVPNGRCVESAHPVAPRGAPR